MLSPRMQTKEQSTPYAMSADFCRIFEEHMSDLYLLSFLLTADRGAAEECFVRGLDDAANSNRIFKEWAASWARRTIIQNAIQLIGPRPTDEPMPISEGSDAFDKLLGESPTIAAVLQLATFERFVYVMSVLERYSDQECSLLLDRTRAEVVAARTRALQEVGSFAELHGSPTSDRDQQAKYDVHGSAWQAQAALLLAASA